jgi:hypothetical protein
MDFLKAIGSGVIMIVVVYWDLVMSCFRRDRRVSR